MLMYSKGGRIVFLYEVITDNNEKIKIKADSVLTSSVGGNTTITFIAGSHAVGEFYVNKITGWLCRKCDTTTNL